MCCKGFIKRVFPFFLTFAVGLFIASFFVSITAPNFQFNRGRRNHQEYDRQMNRENQQLREENSRLKKELAEKDAVTVSGFYLDVPPPPPMPPAPPAPPRLYRGR